MAASASSGQRVVLFDFDGVLMRGDAFGLFLRDRYAHSWWRRLVLVLHLPWLLAVLPFSRHRAMHTLMRIGLLGVGQAHYRDLATGFACDLVRRPHQFHRAGLRALRRHQAAGDRVVIVTGCEDILIRGVLAGLGISDVEVLASHLRASRWGMVTAWHNIGEYKLRVLAQHGIEAWAVAYSDSLQDLPMLAGATDPVLVNATPRLCRRVEQALGRAVTRVEWR